jgi:hypothetical protein
VSTAKQSETQTRQRLLSLQNQLADAEQSRQTQNRHKQLLQNENEHLKWQLEELKAKCGLYFSRQ